MTGFKRYLTDELISTETCMAKVKISEKTATIWQLPADQIQSDSPRAYCISFAGNKLPAKLKRPCFTSQPTPGVYIASGMSGLVSQKL
jgi:hypothetical protein